MTLPQPSKTHPKHGDAKSKNGHYGPYYGPYMSLLWDMLHMPYKIIIVWSGLFWWCISNTIPIPSINTWPPWPPPNLPPSKGPQRRQPASEVSNLRAVKQIHISVVYNGLKLGESSINIYQCARHVIRCDKYSQFPWENHRTNPI